MIILETTDVPASHQYLRAYRQTKLGEPESRLMLAVLLEAMQTYQKFAGSTSSHGKALFRDVEKWFWSANSDGVFSFVNICEVFGLDPSVFRQGLLRWAKNRKGRESSGKVFQLRNAANRRIGLRANGLRAE